MPSASSHPLLAGRRAVTIFGSSEPEPGQALYEEARRAGARLAGAGLVVVNGGYGGTMEAASRGAQEAQGTVIGVTVDSFDWRGGGNRWLDHEIREPDLYRRTRTLVELADAYLILPGQAGTLAEVSFLWALRRGRLLGDRPVVLAGPPWTAVVGTLREKELLDPATLEGTWIAPSVEDGVSLLLEKLT
jgi:uncharacterized protein (TIGR00725 family)